jgi:three-Cys-motif partner protein
VAKKEIDPKDGLVVDVVGPWASKKHLRLSEYIRLARGARANFVPPKGTAGASYIELFSASGRSRIGKTSTYIDGSPLVAYRAARDSGVRFSDLHFNDIDQEKTDALKALSAPSAAPL